MMASNPIRPDVAGFSGKPHPQYQDELDMLIELFRREQVHSYLEIGCRYGDTFHKIALGLPVKSKVVALDLPGAKSGFKNKGGHRDSFEYLQRAVSHLASVGYDAHAVLGDSHEAETRKRVEPFAPFDALFIDGDHSAPGVEKDWAMYGQMGHLVAFHDIAGSGKWARQIRPIFDRLAEGRRHELLISGGPGGGVRRGIGVLWNG